MFRQSLLPGFPEGAQKIGAKLSILEREGLVTYFVGGDSYFSHPSGDMKSKRFILSSLIGNGHVRACDLEGAPLCIPHRTLMNWTKQYRQKGAVSFYRPARLVRPSVMTLAKRTECAQLFAEGHSLVEVARLAGIEESTLRKAKKRQAIPELPPVSAEDKESITISTKSCCSREDAEAASAMGTACTRADERVAAAMGLVECATTVNLFSFPEFCRN